MVAAQVAIGLDVGGTKMAAGLVDIPSGQLLMRREIPTHQERGGKAVLADALTLVTQLNHVAADQDKVVVGIGIGLCELVDRQGNITSSATIAWEGLPVYERFAPIAPTVIESDARAPALAEALYGAGKPYSLFVYVTVGTGISYTLMQDGIPFSGARGNALVLASMPLTTVCTECGAMLAPILEEFASGPALVERYNQRDEANVTSGQAVMAAVATGDIIATEIVRSAGAALGNSVGFLVNILDPEAVIVGGGLGLAGGLYWESFVEATRAHVYAPATRDLPILPASLGVDAGIIGAAATAVRRFGDHNNGAQWAPRKQRIG